MIAPATLLLRRPTPATLSRRALVALGLLAVVASAACDKVPLTAPTGSTVTLFSNTTIVPVNGAAEITATVIEAGGTQVQNGTLVTFTTTIGQLDPAEARTRDGKVTVRLMSGSRSGRAVVRAFSGGVASGDLSDRHRRRRRRLDQPERQPEQRAGVGRHQHAAGGRLRRRRQPAAGRPGVVHDDGRLAVVDRGRHQQPGRSAPRPSPPTAMPTSRRPRAAPAPATARERRSPRP